MYTSGTIVDDPSMHGTERVSRNSSTLASTSAKAGGDPESGEIGSASMVDPSTEKRAATAAAATKTPRRRSSEIREGSVFAEYGASAAPTARGKNSTERGPTISGSSTAGHRAAAHGSGLSTARTGQENFRKANHPERNVVSGNKPGRPDSSNVVSSGLKRNRSSGGGRSKSGVRVLLPGEGARDYASLLKGAEALKAREMESRAATAEAEVSVALVS